MTSTLETIPSLTEGETTNENSTEPQTPQNESIETKSHSKINARASNELNYLIEISEWYTNIGEGTYSGKYLRTKKGPKKSQQQILWEEEEKIKEERRVKRELAKKKKELALKQKREEEERIKNEIKEKNRLLKLEAEEKKRKRLEDIEKNRSVKKAKKAASPKPNIKSKEEPSEIKPDKEKKIKTKDDFLLAVGENVEIPIRKNFFTESLTQEWANQVESLDYTPAATLIQQSTNKYREYVGLKPQSVFLQNFIFPQLKEEYFLLESPDFHLDPLEEIGRLMELAALAYLPKIEALKVFNPESPSDSIVGAYSKAFHLKDFETCLKSIESFNGLISSLQKPENKIIENLKLKQTISRTFIHEFLNQCYSRSVSPSVKTLKGYKAFSSNVYGELMPRFLSSVLTQCGLNENSRFIDLGSGVGNVSIQAALEFGAESYGCEIMENCSVLADLQLDHFEKRCKLFGLNPGKVKLFNRQSFVDNPQVLEVIETSDVILVNNFLFSPALNGEVLKLFTNLKRGTKIISLKSVIPDSHFIDFNDIENHLNKFEVTEHKFGNGSVSWTNQGGVYYITEYTGLISERALTVFNTRSRKRSGRKKSPLS